jgi:DNA-binding CsgD family transcriptional regulator
MASCPLVKSARHLYQRPVRHPLHCLCDEGGRDRVPHQAGRPISTDCRAIRAALAQDRKLRQRKAELAKLQERFALLTPREREVLPLIVGGLLNKQAASVLGISEVTLQIHRSQVMRKIQAESFAELVRMAVKLRTPYWREGQPDHARQQESSMFVVPNGSGSLMQNEARRRVC